MSPWWHGFYRCRWWSHLQWDLFFSKMMVSCQIKQNDGDKQSKFFKCAYVRECTWYNWYNQCFGIHITPDQPIMTPTSSMVQHCPTFRGPDEFALNPAKKDVIAQDRDSCCLPLCKHHKRLGLRLTKTQESWGDFIGLQITVGQVIVSCG